MKDRAETTEAGNRSDFEGAAATPPPGFVREFVSFMKRERKWWLAPLLALLVVGILVVLSATASAPFVYALF